MFLLLEILKCRADQKQQVFFCSHGQMDPAQICRQARRQGWQDQGQVSTRHSLLQATREGVPPKLARRGWLDALDGQAGSFGLFHCLQASRAAHSGILRPHCSAWLGGQHGFCFAGVLCSSSGGLTGVFGRQEVCPDRDSRRQEASGSPPCLARCGQHDEQGMRRCFLGVAPHREGAEEVGEAGCVEAANQRLCAWQTPSSRMYAGAMGGFEPWRPTRKPGPRRYRTSRSRTRPCRSSSARRLWRVVCKPWRRPTLLAWKPRLHVRSGLSETAAMTGKPTPAPSPIKIPAAKNLTAAVIRIPVPRPPPMEATRKGRPRSPRLRRSPSAGEVSCGEATCS